MINVRSGSFSLHANSLWVHFQKSKANVLRGTPSSHRTPWTGQLRSSNELLQVGRACSDDCGNHGGGREGIFFWGLVREGFPLKIKIFSELKYPYTLTLNPQPEQRQPKPEVTTLPWRSSLKAFLFPNFQGKLASNFHISMAFTSAWKVFPSLFIILSLPLHPTNVRRPVSEVISSGTLTSPPKWIILLSVLPTVPLISTALADHTSKWCCPFPSGLPLPSPLFQYMDSLWDVALFYSSLHPQHLDSSELNRDAE